MSKSGWLTKKAVKTLLKDSWKRRWFTLTENMITYSAKKGGSAKNLLVLTAASTVEATNKHGADHPFELVVQDSSFTLFACGTAVEVRDAWIGAIQAAINKLRGVGAVDLAAQQRLLQQRMEALRLQEDARQAKERQAILERTAEVAAPATSTALATDPQKLKRAASVRRRLAVMETTSGRVTERSAGEAAGFSAAVVASTAKAVGAGANSHGQLGNGSTATGGVAKPDEVAVLTGPRAPSQLCMGESFALAVTEGGLLGWGDGSAGQLGVAEGFSGTIRPFPVPFFRDVTIKSVACGDSHALVLDAANNVYAMGTSSLGALGLGVGVVSSSTPRMVMSSSPVSAVRAGGHNSAVLTASGDAFVWGSTARGVCGIKVADADALWRPVLLRDALLGHGVADIAFARSFTLILAVDLEAAGRAACGPAATAEEQAAAPSRALERGFQADWVSPVAGWACPVPCQLLVCGAPGALEAHFAENEEAFTRPHYTRAFADRSVARAVAAGRHIAAVLSEGSVHMLGTGILGTATANPAEVCREHPLARHNLKALELQTAHEPVRVPDLDLHDVTQLAVGAMHCMALTRTGQVLAFGANDTGVLGTGSCADSPTPVPAMLLPAAKATQIATYDSSALAITKFGSPPAVSRSRRLAAQVANKLRERVRAARAAAAAAAAAPFSVEAAVRPSASDAATRRVSAGEELQRRTEHAMDSAAVLSTLQEHVALVEAALTAPSTESEEQAAEAEADPDVRGGWRRHFDEDGSPFYEHLATSNTQWEAPSCFA